MTARVQIGVRSARIAPGALGGVDPVVSVRALSDILGRPDGEFLGQNVAVP